MGIFRKVALDRLSSPDQLDQLLRVTNPTGWVALCAVAALLCAAVSWGLAGSIPVVVEGQGVVLEGGAVTELVAITGGQVEDLLVAVGDSVEPGQVLATIRHASPCRGIESVELAEKAGETRRVAVGRRTETPEARANPGSAVVALYIPASEGKRVRPGMKVKVRPYGAHAGELGSLAGEVQRIEEQLSSPQSMLHHLGSEELVRRLVESGPRLRVDVVLSSNDSASQTSELTLTSGSLMGGAITLETVTPASVLFSKVWGGADP